MTTIPLKESSKTKKNQYKLIKGEFSPDDSLEILNHLILEKINFHNRRSFSQFIRSGSADEWSLARIEELEQSREEIEALVEKARAQGKTLIINSNISIEVL